ncbi:MAG: lysophospholipid acyltransferase family protein [Tabrizicola sp.]|uniref:lysophospholipid acyltransferase family protein n=1 Tax=Tabrizicola sp. TaxID=2005166 RepID=UPI0027336002|nr:lysophospholipid acyltransferase family protein [Tabrizicola sp.]MDP3262707.1 lysophospholipid acyltransferase family protein [Tabrizicola sp.]MDP3648903.1 lysophospholipid acyltransferase family protein [Paracoccaceae bacterium]MDZ4067670.1 lysophospholipid acyltransferase family protein [Tabrizicola sp.]
MNWSEAAPPTSRIGLAGWLRVAVRAPILAVITYGGLVVLLLVRLVEWPLFGQARPITPYITQAVCRAGLVILGLRLVVTGRPMAAKGAVVANHSSWLDIFALNAAQRVFFVAKSEVSGWPGIGWLARATGTVFITRKGQEAKRQQQLFEERLRSGHRLLFFPEGTSTDAIRVLPFKSTLFQAFFSDGLRHQMHIQPVTVIFTAPKGRDPRFYGWWGDMDFAGHLLQMLAASRRGRVEVVFHPEVPVEAFENRKILATYCERVIRTAHSQAVA